MLEASFVFKDAFYHFQELLFTLLVNKCIGVAHHGNQHVEKQNGNENLKEDENDLGHIRVWIFVQVFIIIFTESHVKEADPRQVVVRPQSALLGIAFQYEKEGLGETKQEDDVNDAEGEHVPHDHGVYHDNERTRQLDGAEDEIKKGLYVQYEDI